MAVDFRGEGRGHPKSPDTLGWGRNIPESRRFLIFTCKYVLVYFTGLLYMLIFMHRFHMFALMPLCMVPSVFGSCFNIRSEGWRGGGGHAERS